MNAQTINDIQDTMLMHIGFFIYRNYQGSDSQGKIHEISNC